MSGWIRDCDRSASCSAIVWGAILLALFFLVGCEPKTIEQQRAEAQFRQEQHEAAIAREDARYAEVSCSYLVGKFYGADEIAGHDERSHELIIKGVVMRQLIRKGCIRGEGK